MSFLNRWANFFRGGSIRKRILFWMVGISVLVAVLIGSGSYMILSGQIFASQKLLLQTTAVAVSRETGHLLEVLSDTLRMVRRGHALQEYERSGDPAIFLREIAPFQHAFPRLIYIPGGESAFGIVKGAWTRGTFDPSRHPAYAESRNNPDQVVLSPPYSSEELGEPVIDFFLAHVEEEGGVRGGWRGTVPVSRFGTEIEGILATADGIIDILDKENLIIQCSADDDAEETGEDYFEEMGAPRELEKDLAAGDLVFGEYVLEGEPRFLSAENLPGFGWKVVAAMPAEVFLAPLVQLRDMILLITSAVVLLAGVAAYGIGRSIAAPVSDLTRITTRIAGEGDLSERVDFYPKDEVGELGHAFNHMLDRLSEAQNALERKNRALERSNAELDQFAYVVSHDLKAPLRAIANLSLWVEEDLGESLDPENRRQMQLLRGRVRRMEDLINGILEYSRIGRIAVDMEEIEVETLLSRVIESLDVPPSFSVTVGPQMPRLFAPRIRLEQVFANLISNALKYNDKEQGRVEISVEDAGSFYAFAVSDNGPGISPQFHERIFQIFQTLQARDTFESTGVGLTLVKKIVEEQGGTVQIESEEGQGATFHFLWPKGHSERNAA